MAEIKRSKGTTPSEQYLARLADHTFLNLWSYPNVYRDTFVNSRRAGKELCDLLVVCGDQIIIFSIKAVGWYETKDINVAWPRWYKRAIKKSAGQIRRAEGWINQFPDRIFLDSACTQPFPIPIPPASTRKIHGVVIALGAHDACSQFFAGDRGSFLIHPSLIGDSHADPRSPDYSPFTIGDIEPAGSFIHVMNDITLDIVMRELDTITDFTDYLERKAAFARSGHLGMAAGEEELLAYYVTHLGLDPDKKHDFVHPDNRPWKPMEKISFDQGLYSGMLTNPRYLRKKEADKNSYLWDRLIEAFTDHMLAGTTIIPDGGPLEIAKIEIGVRYMAQEPRLLRRGLSEGILGVLEKAHLQPRNFRAIVPNPDKPHKGLGYVFLTVAHPRKKLEGGYEQYRQARVNMLYAYCMSVLYKYSHLKRVIGIASEPPPEPGGSEEFSEDMIMVEAPAEWSQERVSELERLCKHFDIMRDERLRLVSISGIEYPDAPKESEN